MRKITLIGMLALLLGACNSQQNSQSDLKLHVVATTGMIADLVQNIGKDSVQVIALMGPGVDPHLYKATQGDLGRLQSAAIIFYNGLHLEGKMGEIFEKLSATKTVIPVAEAIDENRLLQDPIYPGNYDPHIWFDVQLWAATTHRIAQTLSAADPENRDYYEANAAAYRRKLLELHAWVQAEISTLPAEKRILITAHDAFNYFGKAYGMEVRGLQGISTMSEFGLRDRVDLVNFIVEKGIKAVFVETSVSEKNIDAIVEACRQKGHEVTIGGNLYSDAMGEANTPEGTYTGMVRANVRTIVEGLK